MINVRRSVSGASLRSANAADARRAADLLALDGRQSFIVPLQVIKCSSPPLIVSAQRKSVQRTERVGRDRRPFQGLPRSTDPASIIF